MGDTRDMRRKWEDQAQRWADWLRTQLNFKGWSQGDLIAHAAEHGSYFGKSAVSRWLIGENIPSSESVFNVAKALGADPRDAYEAAGYRHLMGMPGDVVVASDPVDIFVQQIRSRGFPPQIEERLIARLRADLEEQRKALDAYLDTVAEAMEFRKDAS